MDIVGDWHIGRSREGVNDMSIADKMARIRGELGVVTYGNPSKGVVLPDPYAKIREEQLQLGKSTLLPNIKITIPMPRGAKLPRTTE